MSQWTRFVVVAIVALHARVAGADEVDDLVERGDSFAKQGEWARAIQAFKQADAERPRAKHACLIGLAYTRRDLWAQAELFFARCHARASSNDPMPDWLAAAEQTLTEKLASAGAATITVGVTPPNPLALISVSSFAPDETFAPRTFHLAPGTYTITASAPGSPLATETITVEAKATRTVTLHLAPAAKPVAPVAPQGRSSVPAILWFAGGALLAGGGVHHLAVTQPARERLDTELFSVYDANHDDFLAKRRVTVGLYAAGALVGITGLVLRFTVFRGAEHPTVALTPVSGGALVSAQWRQ